MSHESPETDSALLGASETERFVLRLFVSGMTARSATAIRNIRSVCEERLQGRYELEIVDIYQHPDLTSADQIVAVPTLVRKRPLPLRLYIGDLSDRARLIAGLGLPV